MSDRSVLVLSAHPGDFVWRCGGAIALAVAKGERVVIGCMSFGERGESASLWLKGYELDEVKAHRRDEAERAAAALGAEIRFYDRGDYPLVETPELIHELVSLYREVQPAVVLTHAPNDPYNPDHATAHTIAMRARVFAQAPGVRVPGQVIGAPPVFCFEPHQPEQCGFMPDVLLDISEGWERKREAMDIMGAQPQPEQCGFMPDVLLDISEGWERKREAMDIMGAQSHLVTYYTELGRRRGTQAARNSGPNLGLAHDVVAEAYQRVFPQVTKELA